MRQAANRKGRLELTRTPLYQGLSLKAMRCVCVPFEGILALLRGNWNRCLPSVRLSLALASRPFMTSGGTVEKICTFCGEDVSDKPRVKDARGRYYCKPCAAR